MDTFDVIALSVFGALTFVLILMLIVDILKLKGITLKIPASKGKRLLVLEKGVENLTDETYCLTKNTEALNRYIHGYYCNVSEKDAPGLKHRIYELEDKLDKLNAIVNEIVDDYYGGK